MNNVFKKNLIFFILIIAGFAVVSGCGRKENKTPSMPSLEKGEQTAEQSATEKNSEVGETHPLPLSRGELATSSSEIATSTAEVDTSEWKTYRNTEYGFELKYPEKEFNIKTEDNALEIHFYGKENCSDIASPMSPPGPKCMNINISVKKLSKNIVSLNDLISKENLDLAPKNERLEINGQEAIISEFFLENGDPYAINAFILGNNYYYEIDMGGQYFLVTEELRNKFINFLDNFKII